MKIQDFIEKELGIQGKPASTGWYRACCPIHGERTPSFAIYMHYPYVYNCLACGASGQLPALVAFVKKMPYRVAIEYVKDRLSLDVADVQELLFKKEKDPYVSEAAIKAFKQNLQNSPALRYCKSRGIPRVVLEQFNAGYEALRGRMLVPLYGLPELHRAVGFDVRELDVEVMKSVEVADGWRKRSVIYPVNVKRPRGVIVVEGFFDAANVLKWLLESGRVKDYTVAAICGNRVSTYHASLFSEFDNICCGFDNDRGGEVAVERLYQLLPERVFKRLIFAEKDPGASASFSIVSL